jgi:hypothetical protein
MKPRVRLVGKKYVLVRGNYISSSQSKEIIREVSYWGEKAPCAAI